MEEHMDTSTSGEFVDPSPPGPVFTSTTGASSAASEANRSQGTSKPGDLTSTTGASSAASAAIQGAAGDGPNRTGAAGDGPNLTGASGDGPNLTGLFIQKRSTPVSPDAHKRVGLGRNGQVVIATASELHMYQLKRDGSYERKWSQPLINFNVSASCYKRVFDNGRVLLQEGEHDDTFMFDENMERIDSWQHEGHLIGNLSSSGPASQERPVYKVTRQEDSERRDLQIVNESGEDLQRLRLTEKNYKWCGYLSLCESVKEKKIAVLAQHHKAVDFFDRKGDYLDRVKISYDDFDENGICCTEDFIFVVGNFRNTIYVFNWSGRRKGYQEKESLGLSTDEKICAIQYNPGDRVLQMAVSDNQGKVRSLNSYKLGDLPR